MLYVMYSSFVLQNLFYWSGTNGGCSLLTVQPKVNVGVAGRLVRGALWDQVERKRQREEEEAPPHTKRTATSQ